ncbi:MULTISPECIES: fimbrial protein [unclassified Serratia (in: enterobacteria)]|uniref:fimbrial protein n=1 Tax=unclassified Serratia (in: enterobacteria) TaxID=2647522 RepID=UPI0005071321|nr:MULTISPECIES: fimbrial protein [unclassified Serratia (in: enterobacteria)]KFK96215.1 hypothetical protein JV45_05590 [Serratia sp. Ag2]KFL00632.1 hypothetical protein IV04_01215 [Serratia sp. Ag1]
MKKTVVATVFASLAMLATTNALAVDGTIHFTGNILDSACNVTSGVAGTQTVALGNFAKSDLATAGMTSAGTAFTVTLSGCPANGYTKASLKFDGTTVTSDNTLLALDTGQTATGVGVQLLEQDGATPIAMRTDSVAKNLDLSASTAVTSLNFVARYKAFAGATAGTANATTTFEVDYN